MEKEEEIVNNHRKSENLIIVLLIAFYIILSEGINIHSIVLSVPFFAIGFCLFYFVVLFGLKIFKIRNISGNKITIYILSISVLGLIFSLISSIVIKISLNNIILFNIVYYIIYCFSTFVFFRYYFLLSVKQVLQLFLYLTFSWLIFSKLINYLLFTT